MTQVSEVHNLFILTRMTRIYTKRCSTRNYHTKHLLCDEGHENHPEWNSCFDKKHWNFRNL